MSVSRSSRSGSRASRRSGASSSAGVPGPPEVRFDDIERLTGMISDEFSQFGPQVQVTQEMIRAFATLTGDHQWIHVDEERCREESPFGTTIAHGFLVLSLLPKVQLPPDEMPFAITGFGNVINYGSDKLRFTGVVKAGESIHMRQRLRGVLKKKSGVLITMEMHIHVVGDASPGLVYEVKVLYQPPIGALTKFVMNMIGPGGLSMCKPTKKK